MKAESFEICESHLCTLDEVKEFRKTGESIYYERALEKRHIYEGKISVYNYIDHAIDYAVKSVEGRRFLHSDHFYGTTWRIWKDRPSIEEMKMEEWI